jgi:hypothetical protein
MEAVVRLGHRSPLHNSPPERSQSSRALTTPNTPARLLCGGACVMFRAMGWE